jgi:hypothetical protein
LLEKDLFLVDFAINVPDWGVELAELGIRGKKDAKD